MSYKVTNISGGLLVCDLTTVGKTLRLNNKKAETIKDYEVTPHIKNLANKGLVLLEEVAVIENQFNKKAVQNSKKVKEKED